MKPIHKDKIAQNIATENFIQSFATSRLCGRQIIKTASTDKPRNTIKFNIKIIFHPRIKYFGFLSD